MCNEKTNTLPIRTRFAPSPTGFMHVGNLRTALYEYLTAKAYHGQFVLRIEDTDQNRIVESAIEKIYKTLSQSGIQHDEGPDIGGPYGPYIQSERMDIYLPYAEQLVKEDKAYYCFCTKERLEGLRTHAKSKELGGYDRHCRSLSQNEIEQKRAENAPYVIRQKVPLSGQTSFFDEVFGTITVENTEIEDQVLIKADGFPTYNFANIIDDHLMRISHVVRGSEYLSSTPKYNLLYEAFGWPIPTYIHLPLIQGKNPDGSVSKLSKRHGATSFEGLCEQGFLPDAIINYIALLGWCPKDSENEVFSIQELENAFSISGISKAPATFDYDKLEWFNGEYIRKMDALTFLSYAHPYISKLGLNTMQINLLPEILQPRINFFHQIPRKIAYLQKLPSYELAYFEHKKSKSSYQSAANMLRHASDSLDNLEDWSKESIYDCLSSISQNNEVKKATVMWPVRIAVTGTLVTPGGAIEALLLLGKEESLARISIALEKLNNKTEV